MSTNLLGASHQWATRPPDERFWGLHDMGAALADVKTHSRELNIPVSKVRVTPGENDELTITATTPIKLTHWSMGQLSSYADAPAQYLRRLPAPLAAQCLNTGLEKYNNDGVQLLVHRNDGPPVMRSMTTKYSRLWNDDIVKALRPATDYGWIVPPARPVDGMGDPRQRAATAKDIVPGQDAFGLSVKVGDQIAPAGCYASDRDMFVFMVNPKRVIDVDGSDGLMRGIFLWNSEVGAGAFKVQTFYLEAVCGNHIVWGAKDVRTFRMVHKGNNFQNFGHKLKRQLEDIANRDTSDERRMIESARNYVIGKNREEVVDTLHANRQIGLSKTVIDAAYTVAVRYEHTAKSDPTTAWGMAHGLTRYSQTCPNADDRNDIDTSAGKLLQLAYTAKN